MITILVSGVRTEINDPGSPTPYVFIDAIEQVYLVNGFTGSKNSDVSETSISESQIVNVMSSKVFSALHDMT